MVETCQQNKLYWHYVEEFSNMLCNFNQHEFCTSFTPVNSEILVFWKKSEGLFKKRRAKMPVKQTPTARVKNGLISTYLFFVCL